MKKTFNPLDALKNCRHLDFLDYYYDDAGYLVYVLSPVIEPAEIEDEIKINKFLKKLGNYRIVDEIYEPWIGNSLRYYITNYNRKLHKSK